MIVYLIRHGEAESYSSTGRDFDRVLTEKGKQEFSKMVSLSLPALTNIEIILSSPLKRALQTAEILYNQLNKKAEIIRHNELAPGLNAKSLEVIWNLYSERNEIALVAHQPDLSDLVYHYCNLDAFSFKKGGILKIAFRGLPKQKGGNIDFYIYPKLFK